MSDKKSKSEQGRFRKSLSLLDLTFLGIGSIIGSGWLYAAQNAANLAGPLAWVSWIIGAVVIILIGMVYAELGAALPRAGGFIRYPNYTHGTLVGYLIGFSAMLAYSSVVGIEVEAVRGYAQTWWTQLGTKDGSPSITGFAFQFALLIIFLLLNYWSVNIFGKANTIVTVFKFIVPILIIIFLLMHLDFSNFHAGGAKPGGVHGIFTAVAAGGIVFTFQGFRQPIEFAGEAKNPQRDVPLAIVLAVVVGLIIYLLLQFAFVGAIPAERLANGGWANIHFDSPFAKLVSILSIGWLANLVLIDAVISPSGTSNIYFSANARSIYAWSKNGFFYSLFHKIDKKTGVPRPALILTFILAVLWMLPAKFQVWQGLVTASTSAMVLTYCVGPVSVTSLRKSNPDLKRPFVLKPLHIISPLAFIAATLVIYWSGWDVVAMLVGILIGSLVLYFAFADKTISKEQLKTDFQSSIWLFGYYIFVFIMSYLGSFGPHKYIPAPWDTVITGLGVLAFYYWGVATALPKARIGEDDE